VTKLYKPSHKLSFEEAVEVWLLSFAGEFQNRIAARFDVNPGRINEILKGRKYIGSREIALRKLAA